MSDCYCLLCGHVIGDNASLDCPHEPLEFPTWIQIALFIVVIEIVVRILDLLGDSHV